MQEIAAETARALAFLSRLPVPERYFDTTQTEIAQSARAYPLAGVALAIPAAVVFFLLLAAGLAPLFASALAVVCLIMTTGALHEDGLADCADGFWGGRDRDSILLIMKDSTIGVYGALALILMVILRIAGLAAIAAGSNAISAALALLAVAALSRAAMVWHWHVLPAAKPDGVAASAGRPDGDAMVFAALSGGALAAVLGFAASGFAGVLSMFVLAAIVCTGFSRIARGKIGGHTGDSIGATQLVCEIASLLGLALWV